MQPLRPSSASSTLPKVDQKSTARKKSAHQSLFQPITKPSASSIETPDQQLKKTQVLESLGFYEKQLMALKGTSQQQSEVDALFKQLNKFAMAQIEKNGFHDTCILILQWIIQHKSFQEIPTQICLAYNNMGCVYRRIGQTQLAFNALENALQLVQMYDQIKMETITYLNITTVLSQMNMHDKALKASLKAIQSGKKEFDPNQIETVRCLALANLNYAFELEALDRLEEAVKQYKRSLQFVLEHLGNHDPLFQKFHSHHHLAKQKLIVQMNQQQPGLFKTVLQLKKNYEVPTDESFQQTTPICQTKKYSTLKRNNYMEDLNNKRDSSATIKKGMTDDEAFQEVKPQKPIENREEPKQVEFKMQSEEIQPKKVSQVIHKKMNQIEQIQIDEWSNSEPSDTEVKKQRLNERSPELKVSSVKVNTKDQRLNFLSKQNTSKQKVDENLLEKEQQIIREIEEQIYNANSIAKIQAQFRMKKERKKFYCLKKAKKDQGELLPSDELKLKQFQRFIKRKLMELKMREITKKIVQKNKLKKFPNTENQAYQRIISLLETYKAYKRMLLHKYVVRTRQFQTLRQSYCHPNQMVHEKIEPFRDAYIFTFGITNDDSFVRFSLVNGVKNKRKEQQYYFEMDTQSFLKSLGLLHQYIGDLECFIIEENQLLRNLKNLQTVAQQFIIMNEVDGKYVVRCLTEFQTQFRQALQRTAVILQELILVDNSKLYIQGINNFEYNDVVPFEEEVREIKPPLYTKKLSENELASIKFIQSFMKGYLQRIRVQKWVSQKQKQIYSTNLIKTVTGHYLKIVKAQNILNKKHYLYIINQETQKKSNDLEIKQIVFLNMGEITRENIFEILKVDLDGPSIEYSDEANYWVQKQEDYQKRGGKETYSKISKDDSIVLIQRAVLRYLLKRRCSIKKINKAKFNTSDQKDIEREILVRRAIIYGSDMNQRACLTTLYLEIERTDPNTSLMGQSEYQSVLITSKNLEHVYAFDKCVPFYQKLFYPLSRTEIITVAQRMVEVSRIVKNKKGEPKVECKSVDQVHGEILSKQGEEDDINQKKENTLDARLKIGSTLRDKYLQQFVSCLEEDPEMKLNHQAEDNKQKNFVSTLQNVFRDFKVRLAQRVKTTKHVDEEDEASIKAYVQNVLPTTEYGTNPNLFNDINQDQLSDAKSQHSLKEDLDFVTDFNITFLDGLFKLQIFFQLSQQLFIIHGQNIYTTKSYKTSILKSDLISNYDLPYSYIKENPQNIILPLIDFQDDKIVFSKDEIKLQKIVDDYLAYEFNDAKSSKKGVSVDHEQEELPSDQITDKVVIAIYQKGSSTLFFEFHREYMIVRIIIHFNNTNEKRVIEIDTHQFQSKYVDERIKDLNNKQVIRFFKEFSRTITKVITINEKDHTHNFEDLRGDLSLFLREKFVQKIQGMLMVKRMVEKFKLYKQLKRSKLHIHKFIVNNGQHYIEISYFLIKQSGNLQLSMRELTFVTPQGHLVERSKTLKSKRRLREKQFLINLEKLSQQSDQLINSQTKRQDQLDLQRIDFSVLSNYDQMKTIQYYRSLMTPLISLIQKNLVVNFNKFQFSLTLPIIMIESHIMKKKKKNYSHETKFQLMTYAAIAAQSTFRKKLLKKWLQTKLARKRQIEEKNKHLGEFIKRSFKIIREDDKSNYYIINVYKQPGKIPSQIIYTFELIPINKSDRKTKMRASYSHDNFQLIDLGSQSLANHFINKIYIERGIIKFDEYSFQKAQDDGISTTFEDNPQNEQQNINADEKMIEKDAQEVLIDQEKTGNTLINIVYTNSKQLLDKKSYDDSQNNVTKLQVDLQSIKKLYPNFNVKDPNTVKILSQNLRKGVRMDQFAGSLMIDKSRIQSSLINPLSVGVGRVESQVQIQSQFQIQSNFNKSMRLSSRPYATNVLAKETMNYTGKKYLIVISQVKNKIQKILNQDRDSVFEDHERILEIKAQNLKERSEPFAWYLTPDDAEILTHEKSPENMAKVLTKNLQIINSKFIYLCFNQQDQQRVKLKPEDNVILFVESTIRPMQTKFRNRRIFSNYKEYRKTLIRSRAEGTLILHLANNLNTTKRMFVILFIEEKESSIQMKTWDATEQMYFCETELQLKKYQSIYFSDKQKCLKALMNFLEFRSEQNKIQFLHPKPEQVQDYFEKEKKLSIHSSSKIGSPTKSVDQNNEQQQQKFFQQEHTPMQSPMMVIEDYQDDGIEEIVEDVIQQ